MPIYEYQCTECEHYLDALQKIGAAPLGTCPSCGKQTLKRLLSAPRFRLKGKGWYETDFKTGDKRNLAGEGAAKGNGKAGAKPDESGKSGESGESGAKPKASKSDDKAPRSKSGSGAATRSD